VDQPVAEALDRDLARSHEAELGERVEAEWDAYISREDRRRLAAGEISSAEASEIMWRNACEHHNAERRQAARFQWVTYHRRQAQRHRAILGALVDYHEQQAQRYAGGA